MLILRGFLAFDNEVLIAFRPRKADQLPMNCESVDAARW